MRIDDLIITIAYFSIPVQILVSLYAYPRLASMPLHILILAVLFAFFIFLCGAGHLMRCMHHTDEISYDILNSCTAFISLVTALYLLPLVPNLMNALDQSLQDLVKLNQETIESKNKLMTFMAFLCHEIRNPLFAITSNITFLGDEQMTKDKEEALNAIDQSARLMLRLVNDVLEISRLESGVLTLEAHDFDLHHTLSGIADSVRAQIKHQHGDDVHFSYFISRTVPRVVCADSARLSQIAYNLLSNACKFTERGYVGFRVTTLSLSEALREGHVVRCPLNDDTISTTASVDSADNSHDRGSLLQHGDDSGADVEHGLDSKWSDRNDQNTVVLRLEVFDTGCGVSPDRIKHIFTAYTKSKLSDYRTHGGTGLGLPIVANLIKAMGGTITVTSEAGKGSTFVVYLAMNISHQPASGVAVEITSILKDRASSSSSNSKSGIEHGKNCQWSRTSLPESTAGSDLLQPSSTRSDKDDLAGGQISESLASMTGPVTHSPNGRSCEKPQLQLPSYQMNLLSMSASRLDLSLATSRSPIHDIHAQSQVLPSTSKKRPMQKFNYAHNEMVVLVVDDNAVNRKLLSRMLSHFALQHDFACHGQQAVDKVKQSRNNTGDHNDPHYCLILMDMSMPVMDGCEAIRIIRQRFGLTKIPIVALTANALEEGRQKALDAGATEFATKPILRDDLHAKCCHYLLGEGSATAQTSPEIMNCSPIPTHISESEKLIV